MSLESHVREYVCSRHRAVVQGTLACADHVDARMGGPDDRRVVAASIERALREAGVLEAFPGVIRTIAAELDTELPAEPVSAPPYVVVTARGPLIRVTLPVGRIVVLIRTHERTVEGYVRANRSPEKAVEVAVHEARHS